MHKPAPMIASLLQQGIASHPRLGSTEGSSLPSAWAQRCDYKACMAADYKAASCLVHERDTYQSQAEGELLMHAIFRLVQLRHFCAKECTRLIDDPGLGIKVAMMYYLVRLQGSRQDVLSQFYHRWIDHPYNARWHRSRGANGHRLLYSIHVMWKNVPKRGWLCKT